MPVECREICYQELYINDHLQNHSMFHNLCIVKQPKYQLVVYSHKYHMILQHVNSHRQVPL
jgi:hypothetical protein